MNIHDEVNHILAGIELDHQQKPTLEECLRNFLAMMVGEEWRDCALMSNSLPVDGRVVYTAWLLTEMPGGSIGVMDRRWTYLPKHAMQCVVVARDEFGQFQLAPWCPVTGYEEM